MRGIVPRSSYGVGRGRGKNSKIGLKLPVINVESHEPNVELCGPVEKEELTIPIKNSGDVTASEVVKQIDRAESDQQAEVDEEIDWEKLKEKYNILPPDYPDSSSTDEENHPQADGGNEADGEDDGDEDEEEEVEDDEEKKDEDEEQEDYKEEEGQNKEVDGEDEENREGDKELNGDENLTRVQSKLSIQLADTESLGVNKIVPLEPSETTSDLAIQNYANPKDISWETWLDDLTRPLKCLSESESDNHKDEDGNNKLELEAEDTEGDEEDSELDGEETEDDSSLLKELCRRVSHFEDMMQEKDKDITYLKFNLRELKKQFTEKENEVESLKVKNSNVEADLKAMKDREIEFKQQCEMKLEISILKNQLLENKISSLEQQLLLPGKCKVKGKMINNNIVCESKIQELSLFPLKLQTKIYDELNKLKDEIVLIKTLSSEVKANAMDQEINELHGNIHRLETAHDYDMELLRGDIAAIDKCVKELKNYKEAGNKEKDKIIDLSKRISVFEKEMGKLAEKCLKVEKAKGCMDEVVYVDEINDLKSHINNIENILFRNSALYSKDITIQWTLQNYKHHLQLGKPVWSPVFFTEIKGYCFRLEIGWTGKRKEHLGVYFRLCRGRSFENVLGTFNMEILLEVHDNRGNKEIGKIDCNEIKANRQVCFSIHPEKDTADSGYGFPDILSMPDLRDYVVNDMICFKCILTPF